MKSLKWALFLALVLLGAIGMWSTAAANGVPVKIFLSYLPELSNYGATTASGVAQVSIGEAWVEVKAEGLPQLEGLQYEAWLVTADDEKMISMGKFFSDADANVDYYAEFDNIPALEYRYFVISVESVPDPDLATADERRTIAGVFPNTRLEVVSGTPTPTLAPGITPTPAAPAALPVTGQTNSPVMIMTILLVVLISGGIILWGVAFVVKRRSK